MPKPTLVVGNKNYSSWSLRAWLLMRQFEVPFVTQLATGATRLALFERAAMESTLGVTLVPPAANAPSFELGF